MASFFHYEKFEQTAILTLDHPPANTWNLAVLDELADYLTRFEQDPSVRAIVMTGNGERYFSAGIDITLLASLEQEKAQTLFAAFHRTFNAIRKFSGITLAAVNGYALGAGLEWALASDFIVAERGSVLGMPQARFGLLPLAGGGKALTDKVGVSWAKRMMLAGEWIDAETAYRIGLIEEIVNSGVAKIMAISLANKTCRQGPEAVKAGNELIDASQYLDHEAYTEYEKKLWLKLFGSAEQQEGIAAFLEKRPPAWLGYSE